MNEQLRKYLGKNEKRWTMWGRLAANRRVSAEDLFEDGYITTKLAREFLRDLHAMGVVRKPEDGVNGFRFNWQGYMIPVEYFDLLENVYV